MLLKCHIYIFIRICVIFIYGLNGIYSYDIKINNDTESLEGIGNAIDSLSSYNEIKLIFDDDIYNIPINGRNNYNIQGNITFYSEKGTIFDFQYSDKGKFTFSFNSGLTNLKLSFINITFRNYYDLLQKYFMFFFKVPYEDNSYTIEFINCNFIDSTGFIYSISQRCVRSTQSSPQILFTNCKFL